MWNTAPQIRRWFDGKHEIFVQKFFRNNLTRTSPRDAKNSSA
jgi:hypothetical protein